MISPENKIPQSPNRIYYSVDGGTTLLVFLSKIDGSYCSHVEIFNGSVSQSNKFLVTSLLSSTEADIEDYIQYTKKHTERTRDNLPFANNDLLTAPTQVYMTHQHDSLNPSFIHLGIRDGRIIAACRYYFPPHKQIPHFFSYDPNMLDQYSPRLLTKIDNPPAEILTYAHKYTELEPL